MGWGRNRLKGTVDRVGIADNIDLGCYVPGGLDVW